MSGASLGASSARVVVPFSGWSFHPLFQGGSSNYRIARGRHTAVCADPLLFGTVVGQPTRQATTPAGIAADGLSVATPANPAQAAARQRLDRLKSDPQWFQKLLAGEAETTAEYERLNRDLAS